MNNEKIQILDTFPRFHDHFVSQLKNDLEYAKMWFESILSDYEETKDVNDLVLNLKPLIEANYTMCEFAKLIGIHRVTLYKIFSHKMLPSIDVLTKIFKGLGYELLLKARQCSQ